MFTASSFLLQGPRPPSDSHGRYAENKHISGLGMSSVVCLFKYVLTVYFHFELSSNTLLFPPLADMMGPRSSSPANMDGSVSLYVTTPDSCSHVTLPSLHLKTHGSLLHAVHTRCVCPCSETDTGSRSTD